MDGILFGIVDEVKRQVGGHDACEVVCCLYEVYLVLLVSGQGMKGIKAPFQPVVRSMASAVLE